MHNDKHRRKTPNKCSVCPRLEIYNVAAVAASFAADVLLQLLLVLVLLLLLLLLLLLQLGANAPVPNCV
jgi:hypothetical protein